MTHDHVCSLHLFPTCSLVCSPIPYTGVAQAFTSQDPLLQSPVCRDLPVILLMACERCQIDNITANLFLTRSPSLSATHWISPALAHTQSHTHYALPCSPLHVQQRLFCVPHLSRPGICLKKLLEGVFCHKTIFLFFIAHF